MEILSVSQEIYAQDFDKPFHFFGKSSFNNLNREKCDDIYYFLFKDAKVRLGIIFGNKNHTLLSPFSAPFGGFLYKSENIKIWQIDEALKLLENWAVKQSISEIKITLPPVFYNETFISKQSNCLLRAGFQLDNYDLNYQINTAFINENYISNIWHNARKNYKKSKRSLFHFEKVDGEGCKQVYDIIAENRLKRNFPLRMSWEDVKSTIELVEADFFLVSKDNYGMAAAIVFHVAPGVAQIIYWGDLPEYSDLKTMNFLSYELFHYYKQMNFRYIDIGPSTENSTPNHGLCEFKESIGCGISPKMSFNKSLA